MKKNILGALKEEILIADGAMGTYLYWKGIDPEGCLQCAVFDRPELIAGIHGEYVDAGARFIETHTFAANAIKLAPHGLEDRVAEMTEAATRIARAAAGPDVYVAGSVGPLGAMLRPYGNLTINEVRDLFRDQISGLAVGGVDCILIETMSSTVECLEALSVAREVTDVPVFCSMTFLPDGTTKYGDDLTTAFRRLLDAGADGIGLNCNLGPKETYDLVSDKLLGGELGRRDFVLSVMPNAGYPTRVEEQTVYVASPDYFKTYAAMFADVGANIIGGCCGTTPEHIKAMRDAVAGRAPTSRRPVVSVEEPAAKVPHRELRKRVITDGFLDKLGKEFVSTVELDPPKGVDYDTIFEGARRLREAGVSAVNIADNPMARVRMSSIALAHILREDVGIEPILHFTCRDRNLLGLQSELIGAAALGISAILALTGDPSEVGDFPKATSVFDVNSTGLVNMVGLLNDGKDLAGNDIGAPTGITVGVALNPGTKDPERELSRFKEKVDAGADFAITQPFYDPAVWKRWLEFAGPSPVPVIIGTLPLYTYRHALFVHHEIPGIIVPDSVLARMETASKDGKENEADKGVAITLDVLGQIRDLCQGVYVTPPFQKYDIAMRVIEGIV
jgi:methionine synthase I (cobalamin-dependent)/5,10-methylenetetrahydrofolate reductase